MAKRKRVGVLRGVETKDGLAGVEKEKAEGEGGGGGGACEEGREMGRMGGRVGL